MAKYKARSRNLGFVIFLSNVMCLVLRSEEPRMARRFTPIPVTFNIEMLSHGCIFWKPNKTLWTLPSTRQVGLPVANGGFKTGVILSWFFVPVLFEQLCFALCEFESKLGCWLMGNCIISACYKRVHRQSGPFLFHAVSNSTYTLKIHINSLTQFY